MLHNFISRKERTAERLWGMVQGVPAVQWFDKLTMSGSNYRSS
jgi:hypothetical protein